MTIVFMVGISFCLVIAAIWIAVISWVVQSLDKRLQILWEAVAELLISIGENQKRNKRES